jgi:hypothetical protein
MNLDMNTNFTAIQSANDTIGLTLLKKAMDIQTQSAQTLLQALPQPVKSSANLPANLGQNINTTA